MPTGRERAGMVSSANGSCGSPAGERRTRWLMYFGYLAAYWPEIYGNALMTRLEEELLELYWPRDGDIFGEREGGDRPDRYPPKEWPQRTNLSKFDSTLDVDSSARGITRICSDARKSAHIGIVCNPHSVATHGASWIHARILCETILVAHDEANQ